MTGFATRMVGAAALVAAVAAPVSADARHPRYGYGYGDRYHDRDRIDAGDVVAGVFLIGVIAAIASAAGKAKDRDRRERGERPDPRQPAPDWRAGRDPDDGAAAPTGGADPAPGPESAMNRAVDACSWAAEGQLGEQARVGVIDSVTRADGGWKVSGSVAAPDAAPRDFSCTFRDGRVTGVTVS